MPDLPVEHNDNVPAAQLPETPNLAIPPAAPAVPAEPIKPKSGRKKLFVIIALVILLAAAGGGGYWWWANHKKASPKPASVSLVGKQFCYVRLSHLVCVDDKGANPVRYDLPTINGNTIDGLAPSPDQSQYVAQVASKNSADTYWLVDSSFKNPKQLLNQTGDVVYQPSWSHDGKQLFMEIDPKDQATQDARHIYKYDIATSKFTKLTSSRLNMQPHQLADGRILYSSYSGTTDSNGHAWIPYIMNADGSKPQAYAANLVQPHYMTFSYDLASDTVYFLTSASTNDATKGMITYFPASSPSDNKMVDAQVGSSGDAVYPFYSDKIIFNGTILSIPDGTKVATIDHIGNMTGMINPAGFTKSAAQTEDPHERIAFLSTAPADFQTFITAHFDEVDKQPCADPAMQYAISIEGVVRDSFAMTSEGGCDGGAHFLYAKQNGAWVKVTATQAGVECSLLNQYKFTKELVADCYPSTTSSKTIANTNP